MTDAAQLRLIRATQLVAARLRDVRTCEATPG